MPKVNHIDGIELRRLRKYTPYNQEEFGEKIGISRETVNALENNKDTTIGSLQLNILIKWREFCESYADKSAIERFKEHCRNVLGL